MKAISEKIPQLKIEMLKRGEEGNISGYIQKNGKESTLDYIEDFPEKQDISHLCDFEEENENNILYDDENSEETKEEQEEEEDIEIEIDNNIEDNEIIFQY